MNNEAQNRANHNEVTKAIYEKQSLLIEKYSQIKTITQEEIERGEYPHCKEGQKINIPPAIPNDYKEAFELFINYYAAFQCETQKSLFFDTYRSFENENAINAEIKGIEDFRNNAEKISYKEACEKLNDSNQAYEYRRLTGGFYEGYLMTGDHHDLYSVAASIYGKYVLFYEFLKSKLHQSVEYDNDPFDYEKAIGFEKIDTVNQNLNLPIEISVIYNGYYHSHDRKSLFTQYHGVDFDFMLNSISMNFFVESINSGKFYDSNFNVLNNLTVQPYLKEFSKGFVDGYNDFETHIANRVSIFHGSIDSITNKIFEYINAPLYGIPTNLIAKDGKYIDVLSYHSLRKDGIKAGRFYKAWFIVINNSKNFIDLFRQHKPYISLYRCTLRNWEYISHYQHLYNKLKVALEKIADATSQAENQILSTGSIKENVLVKKLPIKQYESFKDIFTIDHWEKYISAFEKTIPPLLNKNWQFIGNRKKHIGVICSWIYHLKDKSIVNQNCNRVELAKVLNAGLKDFDMGIDGKTFNNISNEFERKFKNQLIDITG